MLNMFLLQTGASAVGEVTTMEHTFISLILNASIIIKVIMLILFIFSIISWTIIIFKSVEYKRAMSNSKKFVSYFRKTKNFSEINKFASMFKNSPVSMIFKGGYKELSHQLSPERNSEKINVDSIHRALIRASNSEITRLEQLNGFLATTAAVTPFIGLFGTVWGIMNSFIGLSKVASVSNGANLTLTAVAPGIAEALIATALGLFAAIPAVIFYNHLLSRLKVIITRMEDFIYEFLNVSEKIK